MNIGKEEALNYHSKGRKGKIEVVATKPCFTSRDLSLAYTPGVAEPCREIHKNDDDVYNYTAKGNLVAVISNGTAVLGLGDIGPHAGKPVMEGKGVLFKRFADIDVFDLELKSKDPKEIIRACELLEPTFGGINLEDIKAPECFEIEEELKRTMNIPVFHDDQHGTAIISCAALINAAEITKKDLAKVRVIVSGAGAASIACCNLYMDAGVKRENIYMFDSKGLIHEEREDLNKYKKMFAGKNRFPSLDDAMNGADVFVGLSQGGIISKSMVKSMAPGAIVFAMANPDPEITYEDATEVRKDIIMATGRSDYPNQVNNVLGFPFIFRGALDVRATSINEEMKMAAVKALAALAKEEVPEIVLKAYSGEEFSYGPDYVIPKPFDPRVLWKVAPAVAKAAIKTGVARIEITDWEKYEEDLQDRLGYSQEIIRLIIHKAQKDPKRIVYPEGEEEKIIRAANAVAIEKIAKPILVGDENIILSQIKEFGFDADLFKIINLHTCEKCKTYADEFFKLRQRKGITLTKAKTLIGRPNYYGPMMLKMGEADALISGLVHNYPNTIRPALESIGVEDGAKVVSGMHIVINNRKTFFFADTTVNINPDAETLADIAIRAARTVKEFDIVPKVAMISFSNFGSAKNVHSQKIKNAVEIIKAKEPNLIVDGEMQLDTAVNPEIAGKRFPFSQIKGNANVLIFPNLHSGNIAYKLMSNLTNSTVIGPILMGMKKPVHVLHREASIEEIINMTAIAVVDAANNS
ncbi:MAG: NADP-dependent malic enzyme [Ignavibacteriae bacterium]|nr:NADP-dependent malic enzyme [Ignavibacteriota bacterium]